MSGKISAKMEISKKYMETRFPGSDTFSASGIMYNSYSLM